MDDTKLNMLTQYLAMKWALVPLHHVETHAFGILPARCSCRLDAACKSAGKHPRLSAWQREENLVRTVEQLLVWPTETNWGLATGRASGVWALDVDPKGMAAFNAMVKAGVIVPTRVHRTGRGGWHVLYAMPDDFTPTNRTGALPEGIDVRGDGGQVVLPPSVSGTGSYSIATPDASTREQVGVSDAVCQAGATLLDLIRPAPIVHVPRVIMDRVDPGGRYAAYARRAVDGELTALRGTHSSRNSRAWAAACRVIELCNAPWSELDIDDEYDRWREAGHAHPDGFDVPPTELDAVWRSALRHVAGREAAGPQDRPWPPAGDVELLDFLRGPSSGTALTPGPIVDFPPIPNGAPVGSAGSTIPTGPVTVEGFTPVDGQWAAVDISDVLDGTAVDVLPELGRRQDGIPLLYRGKEHSVAGEPESGKTWFALLLAAQVLLAGGRVVYVDFEDDARTVVGRLLKLGVLGERLREHAGQFRYVRPETGPVTGDVPRLLTFVAGVADLLVYDGYTEGAALAGRDIMSQNDIALWRQALVKPALDMGCATLVTDHVIKDKDSRGRYAIGAQHKLAGLTGVQFLVDVVETWGKGARGRSKVIITKDRNGGLRPHGQATGTANHTHIGDLVGDATSGDMTSLILWPPFKMEDEGWDGGLLAGKPSPRWSKVLGTLLKRLAASLEPLSQNAAVRDIPGSKPDVIAALHWLVDAGYVDVDERGVNRLHIVSSIGTVKIKELFGTPGISGTSEYQGD